MKNHLSSPNLDDLDHSIIELMKKNGRISFKEVSDRVSVPEATARYRVQRLLSSDLLQLEAWVNPNQMKAPNSVIVNLTVKNGQLNPIADQLAQLEEVQFLSIVAGRHNIVVNVSFKTQDDLLRFFNKLASIRGIIDYETQIVSKLVKARYDYRFN
ncbi:MAG: Lrp/AsnC family transcriptional regulator [Cyanobacteria bacterium REEB459]|nr:Lrp/AsnC family transcriptional regulator [Cyanobacteria bacterium REEB459]